ncbi:MAG: hypothetical protein HY240_01620 [Actinobacteria bacterium]|nr:hypothetical protein [Actinomycetota bacterium]
MKIKGTCKRDGREFLVEQVIAAGGECPWDGEPFEADYAVVLVDALRDAQDAGARLVSALERIADVRPAFELDGSTVLGPLRAQLEKLERNVVARG